MNKLFWFLIVICVANFAQASQWTSEERVNYVKRNIAKVLKLDIRDGGKFSLVEDSIDLKRGIVLGAIEKSGAWLANMETYKVQFRVQDASGTRFTGQTFLQAGNLPLENNGTREFVSAPSFKYSLLAMVGLPTSYMTVSLSPSRFEMRPISVGSFQLKMIDSSK